MFIKLTMTNQVPLYVNANNISHFLRHTGSSVTWLSFANENDDECVTETPEQIMELVNGHK